MHVSGRDARVPLDQGGRSSPDLMPSFGGEGSGVDWGGHLFGAHLGLDARFGAGGLARPRAFRLTQADLTGIVRFVRREGVHDAGIPEPP